MSEEKRMFSQAIKPAFDVQQTKVTETNKQLTEVIKCTFLWLTIENQSNYFLSWWVQEFISWQIKLNRPLILNQGKDVKIAARTADKTSSEN